MSKDCVINILIMLVSGSVLSSCDTEPTNIHNEDEISISLELGISKTTIDEKTITFEKGDEIELICEDCNSSKLKNTGSNSFRGAFKRLGIKRKDCNWFVLYPFSSLMCMDGKISGYLSPEQKFPFDSKSNIMCSSIVVSDYDESDTDEKSFQMNQVMGLIKLTIVNDDGLYETDILKDISIRSKETISGGFSFDIHTKEWDPSFPESGCKEVRSVFDGKVTLEKGKKYCCYLFVKPTTFSDYSIVIHTDKHSFCIDKPVEFIAQPGHIINIPTINCSECTVYSMQEKKKVCCWGDSFSMTGGPYPKDLSVLLGQYWNVFPGGVSGQTVDEIAARQGGIQIVTGDSFTIPADITSIKVSGLLKCKSDDCQDGYYHIRSYDGLLSNPCSINGILCDVHSYYDKTTKEYWATIQRCQKGSSEVYVAEHTTIETYGYRELLDADLTIIYMGANGGWSHSASESDNHYYDNLITYHNYMIERLKKNEDYIVLGYHQNKYNQYYWDAMTYAFNDRVINLHDDIASRGIELLIRTGAYPDIRHINSLDLKQIKSMSWPYLFYTSETDPHPNNYGTKAVAILIYEKMTELKYIY